MTENAVRLEATFFARESAQDGALETAVLNHPNGRALFVYRSEEADRYRHEEGYYPKGEGRDAVTLKRDHRRGLLQTQGIQRVAFPQELSGGGRYVHFYEARYFLAMLEAAPMFLDALEN